MEKQKKTALIYALLAILSWSTASTAFKFSLFELTYYQVLYVSSLVATIMYFVFLVIENKLKEAFQFQKKDYLFTFLSALLNPIAYYLILLKAYSLLPAQIAQPMNYTWPLILVLISSVFLKQKLQLISIISLLISFFGVLVISLQGNVSSISIKEPFGVFLAAFSAVVWAFYWILNVKDTRGESAKLFLGFFSASILMTLYSVFFAPQMFEIEFNRSFYAAIYVGLFELAFPFLLWMKAMKMVTDNSQINNLVYLSPFLALIFIHFVLGEQIYYTTLVGLFFILLGIGLSQSRKWKLIKK